MHKINRQQKVTGKRMTENVNHKEEWKNINKKKTKRRKAKSDEKKKKIIRQQKAV